MATPPMQSVTDATERSPEEQRAPVVVEAPGVATAAAHLPALARAPAQGLGAAQRGNGAGAPTAAMVMAMQQRVGNQAVARMLQRKEGEAAPTVTPGSAPGAQPATGTTAAPAGQKTKNLVLNAIYHNLPGESKTVKSRAATDKDALWIDPLSTHSNAPSVAESTKSLAIVTGGQQRIESMAAPVTDTPTPVGRGSITTELKYTKAKNDSYDVKVTGLKGNVAKEATAAAQAFVREKISVFGDLDEIQRQAQAKLTAEHPEATVAISLRPNKVEDVGRTTVYYKMKGDAEILLDIVVVPDGEKEVTSGGSQTKGSSTDDSTASKSSSSSEKTTTDNTSSDSSKTTTSMTEQEESAYNQSVSRVLDDYVTKTRTLRSQLTEDLSKKVVSDTEFHSTGQVTVDGKKEKIDNWKETIEKGKRKKENWAAIAQKPVKFVKKLLDAPLSILPGKLGRLARKLNRWAWAVDAVDEGLGMLAESGTVDFTDTTVDSKSTTTDKSTTDTKNDGTVKDTTTTTAQIKKVLDESETEEWKRHLQDVTTTAATYSRKVKRDTSSQTDSAHKDHGTVQTDKQAQEAAEAHKKLQNQSTTSSFEVKSKWTYSKPALNATVVGGKAEVANASFGVDPDETAAAPAAAPQPTPAPTPTPAP